ncbi:MAG: N-acetylmuramoyl-L-alanine amidase [Qingshengfaniella sp.]
MSAVPTAIRPGALWHPSPNFGPRRDGGVLGLVVLHYTAMSSAEAALDRLCDPEAEVSAHYLIGRDGRLWQMVVEDRRAWHAGAGGWAGQGDVNSRSIGIEIDNDGTAPFSEPAMVRLEGLLAAILTDHGLSPDAVIGHSDMAPGRKCDPGRHFDWRRLARQGLARPCPAGQEAPPDCRRFDDLLAEAGYPPASHADLLEALRARFRPEAHGPLDGRDMALASGLLRNSD